MRFVDALGQSTGSCVAGVTAQSRAFGKSSSSVVKCRMENVMLQ